MKNKSPIISIKLSFLGYLLSGLCLFTACQQEQSIIYISTPCEIGGEPNLHITDTGKAMLSWVEYLNDSTDVLAYANLENDGQWSAPIIVAQGTNWFVNWADFPSLVAFKGAENHLAAHWLQKSAAGTYDYDVRIAQSPDGGKTWRPSFIPHKDGIAAEHGFVTLMPVDENKSFAVWLDGRYTKTENVSDGHDHEGQQGAMTLRGAFFDKKGNLSGEVELDNKVCDCCSTSAAMTSKGLIVAYRDRSSEEIRDISIVRKIGNDWTRPRRIAKDNWEIAGCPVNGPKIIAEGQKVAIAWFTMAQDTAKVKVVFSSDAGANFSQPIRVDKGKPLGRVGVGFDGEDLIVSWLEDESDEKATIQLAKITPQGIIEKRMVITETSAARRSGFPIMKKLGNQFLLAWTEILEEEEEITTIRSALVNF